MMKKALLSLPIFFLIFLVFFSFAPSVNAQVSYYNWIEGSDFEATLNIAEDGGAESGSFESGVTYGNFTDGGGASVSNLLPYAGVWHFRIGVASTMFYNFTDPAEILGNEVEQFGFYASDLGGSSLNLRITYYYSDLTSDTDTWSSAGAGYRYCNVLAGTFNHVPDVAKYVTAIGFIGFGARGFDCDDVVFRTDQVEGQFTVDYYTDPWRVDGSATIGDISIINYMGYQSDRCFQIGWWESTSNLLQDIAHVDSDLCHFVDMWVNATIACTVRVTIGYSDGTSDSSFEEVSTTGTWQRLVFSGFWDANKYVDLIQISLADRVDGYCYFDDIGLWASVSSASTSQRFTWTFVPTPISRTISVAELYENVAYTFYGFIRNASGGFDENGTFSLHHDYGVEAGNIVNGCFNASLDERTVEQGVYEGIGVMTTIDGLVETWTFTIEWRDFDVAVDPNIDPDASSSGSSTISQGDFYTIPSYVQFISLFIIVGMPSMVMGSYSAKHGFGLQGLLMGALLGLGVGVAVGIVPFWFVFLLSLMIVVFLYSIARRS